MRKFQDTFQALRMTAPPLRWWRVSRSPRIYPSGRASGCEAAPLLGALALRLGEPSTQTLGVANVVAGGVLGTQDESAGTLYTRGKEQNRRGQAEACPTTAKERQAALYVLPSTCR